MTNSTHDSTSIAQADPSGEPRSYWLDYVRQYPVGSAALVLCIVLGAVAGYLFEADLSTLRRVLGGALAGGGAWLLVMCGRVLGA